MPKLLDLGDIYHLATGGCSTEQIGKVVADDPLVARIKAIFPTSSQDVAAFQANGLADLAYTVVRPDLIVLEADMGQACTHVGHIVRLFGDRHPPIFLYSPVEGEPLMPGWKSMMVRQPGNPVNLEVQGVVTVTQYGHDVILRETGRYVNWVYYGIDQDYWRPPTPQERWDARERLGWMDKYVMMDVATNVARKEHPRLFRALKETLPAIPNLYLYDHTKPFQNFWLGGHYLPAVADDIGVADRIIFDDAMVDNQQTSHYQGVRDKVSLREKYWAADVFVHLAEVEGFCLPVAEAMACGLPVITVPYGAGWEAAGDAALGCEIADWTYNMSGTRVAHASPKSVAKQIIKLHEHPKLKEDLVEKGKIVARRYTDEGMRDVVGSEIARLL